MSCDLEEAGHQRGRSAPRVLGARGGEHAEEEEEGGTRLRCQVGPAQGDRGVHHVAQRSQVGGGGAVPPPVKVQPAEEGKQEPGTDPPPSAAQVGLRSEVGGY